MSNFNNTGEVKEISILDMMNGAIGERAAYELTRIMKNCRDFNTEAKKAPGRPMRRQTTATTETIILTAWLSVQR